MMCRYNVNSLSLYDSWTIDKMSRVVSQQNATVLYYQILPSQLLIWVLQPGEGVVRFYNGKSTPEQDDYDKLLLKLICQIKGLCSWFTQEFHSKQRMKCTIHCRPVEFEICSLNIQSVCFCFRIYVCEIPFRLLLF